MATYNDILARLKALMQTVDPSPAVGPSHVFTYPNEYENITAVLGDNEPALPAIIVTRDTSNQVAVKNYTLSSIAHRPIFEILVLLEPGPLQKAEQAALAIELEPNWIPAIATALRDDQGLNGQAIMIGDGEDIFRYQSGHIHFADPKIFWGIRFEIPVNQEIIAA